MTINDFNEPKSHPYSMLHGYNNGFEKEKMLAIMLIECYLSNDINSIINTKYSHPKMVEDGLLNNHGEKAYSLTEKAKGLLYGFYGKN